MSGKRFPKDFTSLPATSVLYAGYVATLSCEPNLLADVYIHTILEHKGSFI